MTSLQLLERETQQPNVHWSSVALGSWLKPSSSLGSRTLQSEYLTVSSLVPYGGFMAQPVLGRRHIETEWRKTHGHELQGLAGQWVVLEGERIIAHAVSIGEAVQRARAVGVAVPYVFRVEEDGQDVVRIGL